MRYPVLSDKLYQFFSKKTELNRILQDLGCVQLVNIDYKLAQGRNRLRNRIEAACALYLPLRWPLRQSGAPAKHNDVILTNLMTSHCFNPIP